jgi:hypothetical protein
MNAVNAIADMYANVFLNKMLPLRLEYFIGSPVGQELSIVGSRAGAVTAQVASTRDEYQSAVHLSPCWMFCVYSCFGLIARRIVDNKRPAAARCARHGTICIRTLGKGQSYTVGLRTA